MRLRPLGANKTELELDGVKILFSYQTPVAALVEEDSGWHQYRTSKSWSKTTSRHINSWNQLGGAFGVKPQEFFDSLVEGGK